MNNITKAMNDDISYFSRWPVFSNQNATSCMGILGACYHQKLWMLK